MKDSKEYLGTVQSMCLNADYAAVSFEGKIQLHMVNTHKYTVYCMYFFFQEFSIPIVKFGISCKLQKNNFELRIRMSYLNNGIFFS